MKQLRYFNKVQTTVVAEFFVGKEKSVHKM